MTQQKLAEEISCWHSQHSLQWTEYGQEYYECKKDRYFYNEDESSILGPEDAAKICPEFKPTIHIPEPEIEDCQYDWDYDDEGNLIMIMVPAQKKK